MKFTPSKDGQDRCTIILRVRLTRQQWQSIREIAKTRESTPHRICEGLASLVIEHEADEKETS